MSLVTLFLLALAPIPNQPSVRIEEQQATFVEERHVQGLLSNNGLPLSWILSDDCLTIDLVCAAQNMSGSAGAVVEFSNLGALVEVSLSPGFEPEFAIFREVVEFRSVAMALAPGAGGSVTRIADLYFQRTIDVPRSARAFWIDEGGFDVFVRVVQHTGFITGSGHFQVLQDMTASNCTSFGPNGPMAPGPIEPPEEGDPLSW